MPDKQQIKQFFEQNIYGTWRSGEKVSYSIEAVASGTPITCNIPWVKFGEEYTAPARKKLSIKVEQTGRAVQFDVSVYLPEQPAECRPYIVSFHPIEPIGLALKKGFALIAFIDFCLNVAADNNQRQGLFYELYPYGSEPQSQTGVLMAWAWGASKVLDALYNGAADELGLNAENSIITGVSRWGKAAAVCGAFESRFKMTAPSCSGAGGLALFDYKSEGQTFDFSDKGGPASYKYDKNEPLGALQSKDEQGWFNNKFLEYKTEAEILLNQENLITLCADKNRFYFMIASCTGEDWVNGPAMWEAIKRAAPVYKELGLENHLAANIHLQGHAVIQEDMEKLTEYFLMMVRGEKLSPELKVLTDFSRKEFTEIM